MAALSTSSALSLSKGGCLTLQAEGKAHCQWVGARPAFRLGKVGLQFSLQSHIQRHLPSPRRYSFPSGGSNGCRTRKDGTRFLLQASVPLIRHPQCLLRELKCKGAPEAVRWGGGKRGVLSHISRQEKSFICNALDDDDDDGEFNSSIIEQESLELGKLFSTLGPLQGKYSDFDLEGKKIFCEQMEMFLDKLQVFTTRYRLMDDPNAKEYVRRLDVMMLEAGTNMYAALQGFHATIEHMKQDIEEQERLGPNYQRSFSATIFRPGWDELCRTDPEVQEAMTDPLILKAVQDVASNPANLVKYGSNPRLKQFFLKVLDPRLLEQSGL